MTHEEAREIVRAYYPLRAKRPSFKYKSVPLPCVPAGYRTTTYDEILYEEALRCGSCGGPLTQIPEHCQRCGMPNVTVRSYLNLEMERGWRALGLMAREHFIPIGIYTSRGLSWSNV